eukprot:TRINITY_DN7509_c0_g1_i2.p1 TRINITY_DN7509_c0_g1~~TRINITY_DN7509_c0_g1_i2.p1  ORF type:complete len:739 (-),score=157.60 TRINITY_DN7509_c0_g1_i2:40-2256(-)
MEPESTTFHQERLPGVRTQKGRIFLNFRWGSGNEIALFASPTRNQRDISDLVRAFGRKDEELRARPRNWNEWKLSLLRLIEDALVLLRRMSEREPQTFSQIQQTLTNSLRDNLSSLDENAALELIHQIQGALSPRVHNKKSSETNIMKWNAFSKLTRRLICESRQIFLDIHQRRSEMHALDFQYEVISTSRLYRAIIMEHIMQLQTAQANLREVNPQHVQLTELADQLQLYQVASFVWHFAEIFLVVQSNSIVHQLVEWISFHFPGATDSVLSEISNSPQPEKSPNYWNIITRYLLQGQIQKARSLLKLHSDNATASSRRHRDDLLFVVQDLLDRMPRLEEASTNEYSLIFRDWQEQCRGALVGVQNNELTTILRILSGDEDTLLDKTEAWYELLIARVIYSEPTIKKTDVKYLAEQCLEYYPSLTILDNIMISIIQQHTTKVITDSIQFFDSWWFVAHLADLLYVCNSLETYTMKSGTDLREHLLTEYALSLVATSEKNMWQIAITYLQSCQNGARLVQHVIENQAVETENKAHRVLNYCSAAELDEQAKTVHRVVAMQHFKRKRYGSAIQWLLRRNDIERVNQLSNLILNELLDGNSNYEEDMDDLHAVLESVGPDSVVSSRLHFLEQFQKLRRFTREKNYREFADLTLKLLESNTVPHVLWPRLLSDLIPVLQKSSAVLGVSQTQRLMNCVQEFESHRNTFSASETGSSVESQDLERLNFLLLQNLSKAIADRAM